MAPGEVRRVPVRIVPIDDIVRGAGASRGTFYLYFASKKAVFDEVVLGRTKAEPRIVSTKNAGDSTLIVTAATAP